MGTNCAQHAADLCFMVSLSEEKQSEVIEAFSLTSSCLDDLLNIDNDYFDGLISQLYPSELQLDKANSSETEAPFLNLHWSFLDQFISFKIYDKRDDFDFEIVNFPYSVGDVPRRAACGFYISHLIRGQSVQSCYCLQHNKLLSAKLLNQGYRYHKLRKAFSKFYRRHFDLVSKFNDELNSLLQQGLSEPEFYGDLVYIFRKIYACNDFSTQLRKIILRYIKIGYNINVIQQTACMVVNQITVVCSTDRSKAVVPVLILLLVALWFILRGDLLYVFPCVILFLCFSVLLVLRLPRLGKRELILVLFVRLFGLCLFRFVGFLFLLGSGKGCGL